jgi:hypothetical protein
MAVLPDGFYDHERRFSRYLAKHFHAVFLRIDEPMLFGVDIRVSPLHLDAETFDGFRNGLFGTILGGPTLLIRGKAQVAAGDKSN